MPIIKLGKRTDNGEEVGIYLLQGNAVRDGELKKAGDKDVGKVSVAAKELEDGSMLFVTVSGWRFKARDVAAVRKMDSVLAVGTLKSHEHNERTYYDMDCDFITVSGVGGRRAITTANSVACDDGFDEVEEPGELPF